MGRIVISGTTSIIAHLGYPTEGFRAPETYLPRRQSSQLSYTCAADLYSVGVCLAMLLHHLDRENEVHDGTNWEAFRFYGDDDSLELMEGLLQPNPRRRFTYAQALAHPFFRNTYPREDEEDEEEEDEDEDE